MAKKKKASPAAEPYLSPLSQKALADRLARAEGHLRSVRQMVVDHRCADEILIQLSAVKAALNQAAASLVESELKACVDSCMTGSVDERVDRISRALAAVLKSA